MREYYLKHRERLKEKYRLRYSTDPDYRYATLERAKRRYHEDPVYRQKTIERAKQRYRRLRDESKDKTGKKPQSSSD